MLTARSENWTIHVVEVRGRWAYIIDHPMSELWNGHVSDHLFDDKESAMTAGINYIKYMNAIRTGKEA